MNGIDTVLFDWDGTLVNTAEASFQAFSKSMQDIGVSMDRESYSMIYSPNWHNMLAALQVPRDRWAEVEDLWLHHYGGNIPELMPGAEVVIKKLHQREFILGIVTNGSRSRVLNELLHCGLEGLFRVVICGEDVSNPKPHPEGLESASMRLGRTPDACCYVGDTPVDVETGRRAGMQTIGIPGPYPGSHKLFDQNPDYIFESLENLLEHFSFGRTN
jgi:HAD superfamily hydrolase (TIGR01509 family)